MVHDLEWTKRKCNTLRFAIKNQTPIFNILGGKKMGWNVGKLSIKFLNLPLNINAIT